MSRSARWPRPARLRLALGAAAVSLLAACTSGAAATPDWRPQQSFQGEGPDRTIVPALPVPSGATTPAAPGSTGPSRSGSAPAPSPSATGHGDPNVVATHLAAPIGLALLPDGTALVGERTTGRIVDVQPRPNRPVRTVRTLAGLDASGDGGLLDLALSPHYSQDRLVFAYITTATDNRVVTFTLKGAVTPVLTGIPKGLTGNAGRLTFGPDGDLWVATGDAGRPALAADPHSLAGKVLRVTDIGAAAPDNPGSGSPVYDSGSRGMTGLCGDTSSASSAMLGVAPDRVDVLVPGASYGWPAPDAAYRPPLKALPTADPSPGGCAVMDNTLYVTSLDGHALLTAKLGQSRTSVTVGSFSASLQNKYGRLRTVVSAPDGALWLTTSNKDGHGSPVPDDERVLRIVPSGGGGTNPA